MVQLNLNFTDVCQYMRVPAHLQHVKLKIWYAHNFDMCTTTSEHMRHTSDACYELALDLPHYTCGVKIKQISIDNEMHQLCIGFAAGQLLKVFATDKIYEHVLIINT